MKFGDLVKKASVENIDTSSKRTTADKTLLITWLVDNGIELTDNIDTYPLELDGNLLVAERLSNGVIYARGLCECRICKKLVWTPPFSSVNKLAKAIAEGKACLEHENEECLIRGKDIPMIEDMDGVPLPPSWRK